MKKFKHKKSKTEEKKNANKFIALTILLLLIVGSMALIVCWIYYKWEWSTIAYWLNPFSDGNQITWVIYIGIVLLLLVLIWAIHMAKVNKNKEE